MDALPALANGELTKWAESRALERRGDALRRPLGEVAAATMQAAARSEHTERAYTHAIGLFLQYLQDVLADELPDDWPPLAQSRKEGRSTEWAFGGYAAVLAAVLPRHLDGFRAWRESEGDSPNTASVRVYAVRTFLSVAYRDGILSNAQALAMGIKPYKQRQKRDRKPVGRRLSKSEARALRDAVDADSDKGRRDLAILDLMLYLGLRCSEVAELNLADFRRDKGRWWLNVTGKGDKTRRVKVHDAAYLSLSEWLAAYGRELGQDVPAFVNVNRGDNVDDNGINTSTISRLVAEYGDLAGLAPRHGDNRLAPHDLRRTAARNAFDNGANLVLVQQMLGHASPDTTARYIGAYDRDDDTAVDYVRY